MHTTTHDYADLVALGRLRNQLDEVEHAIGQMQERVDTAVDDGVKALAGPEVPDDYLQHYWDEVAKPDEPTRWPTDHLEFLAPYRTLSAAVNMIDELTQVWRRLIDRDSRELVDDAPEPSFAAIGVLAALLEHIDLELYALKSHAKDLRELHRAAATCVLDG